jgi:hypothetical protein
MKGFYVLESTFSASNTGGVVWFLHKFMGGCLPGSLGYAMSGAFQPGKTLGAMSLLIGHA